MRTPRSADTTTRAAQTGEMVRAALVIALAILHSATLVRSSVTAATAPDSNANRAVAPQCSHKGHAGQHQYGVVRGVGVSPSQKVPLGSNASAWGVTCAQACCTGGPKACRFWSAADGECSLFPRYAKPSSINGSSAATAVSGAVYYGNDGTNPFAGLKGFNYFPSSSMNDIDMWRDYDKATIERELGWAAAAGFNFCRTWFNFVVWQREGAASMLKLQHFVATAHSVGIQVMVATFNSYQSCVSAPGTVPSYDFTAACFYTSPAAAATQNKTWWAAEGHDYVDALTSALPSTTPGLLLWDVCNEPANSWTDFVVHFVQYFQSKTATPTTVGVAYNAMNRGRSTALHTVFCRRSAEYHCPLLHASS